MAYDERTAERVRAALSGRRGVAEKTLMGGLCFMVNGGMCCSVSGRGGLLVRVAAETYERMLGEPHVQPMKMGQRVMRGFVRSMRAFKNDRSGFVLFAQKKFGLSKDVTEEAYDYMIDSLSQDGYVEPAVLDKAIEEAKKFVGSNKPVTQADVVDYSFLRVALAK